MDSDVFEHIVGQVNAKDFLSLSLYAEDGCELAQPLILGEAGLGKTEIARSYGKAIANKLKVDFIEYATPKDFRLVDDFEAFEKVLVEEESFVIYIDECHEIDIKMTSHGKFVAYIRKALDRQNTGKTFQFGSEVTTYDRSKKVFIFATNHPNKVDSAIKSRMNVINLPTYTLKEMKEIARLVLSKNELEADCEQTLNRIAFLW